MHFCLLPTKKAQVIITRTLWVRGRWVGFPGSRSESEMFIVLFFFLGTSGKFAMLCYTFILLLGNNLNPSSSPQPSPHFQHFVSLPWFPTGNDHLCLQEQSEAPSLMHLHPFDSFLFSRSEDILVFEDLTRRLMLQSSQASDSWWSVGFMYR